MASDGEPLEITEIKQYRVVRELGRGAMGAVYEAVDGRNGERVAIKLLHPWLASSEQAFRDRFEREAHIAALLRSPYTVRLQDFGVASGSYFLVMEYVDGSSVAQELAARGPFEPQRAVRIAAQVARALEEATARGVVHRDIKPDNILLAADGKVKVADFGIARQEGGGGGTIAGSFIGTPDYAAPEQTSGDADHRSDIYSLGATLYAMIAGHPPFRGASHWDVIRQHQYNPVPMGPLADLPDSIQNPIRRCMEKDPRDRYQSASELAGAFERAAATFSGRRPVTKSPAPTNPESRLDQPTVAGPGASSQPPDVRDAPTVASSPAAAERTLAQPVSAAGNAATVAHPFTASMPPRAAANPLGSSAVAKSQAQISLALSPTGGDGAGLLRYTLVASNAGGTAAQLNLTASEPTGLLQISSQPTLFVGAGQSAQAPLEVRQLRTAAKGAKPLQLQVAAFGEDGGRLAFANVSVSPAVSSSSYRPLLMAVLGGFAVVAVIAIALVALNGGDDKKSPAAALSPTAADAASPDAAGAGEAASPAAGTAQPPVTSVKVLDRWDYVFRVDSNDCGFGAPAGDRYPVAFRFQPVPAGATVLKDGDRVRVVGVQDSDVPLGTFTFHPDKFEVSYPVSGTGGKRGNATLLSAFAADGSIQTASLVERYESPACAIAASQVK